MKHITVLLHGSKTVNPFVPCCGSLSSSEIRYGKPNTSTPSTRYDSCEWHVRAATSLSFSFILSLSHTHTFTFYPTSFMTSFIFPLILVTLTQDSGLWLSGRLATSFLSSEFSSLFSCLSFSVTLMCWDCLRCVSAHVQYVLPFSFVLVTHVGDDCSSDWVWICYSALLWRS